MTEQTGYLLLGALITMALVLSVAVALGVGLGLRAVGYVARFRGLQFSRNTKAELSFGGVIDESAPLAPAASSLLGTPIDVPIDQPDPQTLQ